MNRLTFPVGIAICGLAVVHSFVQEAIAAGPPAFRPPAVPLVTFDPYLSVWSEADRLNDDVTRHWTRHAHPLASLIRVDGKAYRLMGTEPKSVPALPQISVKVLPTRSIYEFESPQVHVTMTFMTAALPDDLEALARPLSYITWQVRSSDGATHDVSIFQSVSSQLAVNYPQQQVSWRREGRGPLAAMCIGSVEQPVLATMGDDTRIDWGYVYLAALHPNCREAIGASKILAKGFADNGRLSVSDDANMPRAADDHEPAMAIVFSIPHVDGKPVSRTAMVALDEIYAIRFFGKNLRPYWRRNGAGMVDMLESAACHYDSLAKRCEAFDNELMADLTAAGGPRYAQIAALAYRQCLAGTGIAADARGQPLLFTKENTSNGDIATVDVIFPMEPIFILLSPTLAKASLAPVLAYSASDHWKFPCAPHDLGTYPVCMGRDNGGEAMPVEESGNMLILCDAIAHAEGNADFVAPWWPQLTAWADFLERYGLDPENQLCTDDFMGHLAHNANLSVKAILGLAAYGDLCRMRGDVKTADRYTQLAKADAAHWLKAAADGDHYRLAFDKPGTWSQKYNLVWDRLLGLNVFPPSVAQTETAFYKKSMQRYGLPLDSRTRLTKSDWLVWSATMAEHKDDFQALVSPLYDYLNETIARDPLADSYVTDKVKSGGMHARPVVGGIFIRMLAEPAIWKKWAARDHAKVGPWAPLPVPPKITEVVPTSRRHPVEWQYTIEQPADGWNRPGFDAGSWKRGPGGFGTRGTPRAVVGTVWHTDDIWLRREFVMPGGAHPNLQLLVYHDEDVEIYVNGVLAAREGGYDNSYKPMDIRAEARRLLNPGEKVLLAVHCHQTTGGQGVDVGLADVEEVER